MRFYHQLMFVKIIDRYLYYIKNFAIAVNIKKQIVIQIKKTPSLLYVRIKLNLISLPQR